MNNTFTPKSQSDMCAACVHECKNRVAQRTYHCCVDWHLGKCSPSCPHNASCGYDDSAYDYPTEATA